MSGLYSCTAQEGFRGIYRKFGKNHDFCAQVHRRATPTPVRNHLRLTPTPRLEACHAAEHEVAVGEGRGGGAALRARRARVTPVLAARDGDHVVARAKSLLRHGLV